jgi:hypothetical protein
VASDERIVAIGSLTKRDIEVLGTGLQRMFPLQDNVNFEEVLARLDEVTSKPTEP